MVEAVVHFNGKIRGTQVLLCGAERGEALVTGDVEKITCTDCSKAIK